MRSRKSGATFMFAKLLVTGDFFPSLFPLTLLYVQLAPKEKTIQFFFLFFFHLGKKYLFSFIYYNWTYRVHMLYLPRFFLAVLLGQRCDLLAP